MRGEHQPDHHRPRRHHYAPRAGSLGIGVVGMGSGTDCGLLVLQGTAAGTSFPGDLVDRSWWVVDAAVGTAAATEGAAGTADAAGMKAVLGHIHDLDECTASMHEYIHTLATDTTSLRGQFDK